MPYQTKEIAIVGDGFSGRSTLLHLLKRIKENTDPDAPDYVINLFNRDAETAGGGIAYGMSGPEHLTNIPARMLSAFADDPDDLVNWIEENRGIKNLQRLELRPYNLDELGSDKLVPRKLLQIYMQDRTKELLEATEQQAYVYIRTAEVEDLQQTSQGYRVAFRKPGDTLLTAIEVNDVVLALGHLDPKRPAFINNSNPDIAKQAIIADIWPNMDQIRADLRNPNVQDIVVAGTGLSAFDIVRSAEKEGFFDKNSSTTITLVSHGGAIYPRMDTTDLQLPVIARTDLADPPKNIADVPAYVGNIFDTYRKQGFQDWTIYWSLKPLIPNLIAESGLDQKALAKLARENASLVNITSIGVGAEGFDPVKKWIGQGRVQIVTGDIDRVTATPPALLIDHGAQGLTGIGSIFTAPNRFVVQFSDGRPSIQADRVINAVGMGFDYTQNHSPLITSLRDQGMLITDPTTGVGVAVNDNNQLVNTQGQAIPNLHIVGPMVTGQAMAQNGQIGAFTQNVIGLRQHAGEIAYALTGGHLTVEHEKTIGQRIMLPSGPDAAAPSPATLLIDWLKDRRDELWSSPHPTTATLVTTAPTLFGGPLPYAITVGALEITTRLMPKKRQAATQAHFQERGEKLLERAEQNMAQGDYDLAAWHLRKARKLFDQSLPPEQRSALPARVSGHR